MKTRIIKRIQKNDMDIVILKDRHRIEITEVDNKDNRIFGMSVELYKPGYSDLEHTTYEISWASLGSVDIDKGSKLVTLLQIAIKFANKENAKIK